MPKSPSQPRDNHSDQDSHSKQPRPKLGAYFNFFNVWASRALWPNFPGFLAAAANFFAGIFSPLFTPSELRKAPGFLIAFCIHFSATITLQN